MSCEDSSARWKSVTNATPYSLRKPEISSVANPEPGSGIRTLVPFWPLDLGSGIQDQDPGWVKSQDADPGSGSGMETRNKFLRAEKPFFLFKILKFFDPDPGSRTQDGKNSDLGSGIQDEKNLDPRSGIWDGKNLDPGSGIWDKHSRISKTRYLAAKFART